MIIICFGIHMIIAWLSYDNLMFFTNIWKSYDYHMWHIWLCIFPPKMLTRSTQNENYWYSKPIPLLRDSTLCNNIWMLYQKRIVNQTHLCWTAILSLLVQVLILQWYKEVSETEKDYGLNYPDFVFIFVLLYVKLKLNNTNLV